MPAISLDTVRNPNKLAALLNDSAGRAALFAEMANRDNGWSDGDYFAVMTACDAAIIDCTKKYQ